MLTACTTATSPNLYRVTELVPGISTRDDAVAKLGPPTSTSNIGNSTILQWGGNNSPVHLAISFGMVPLTAMRDLDKHGWLTDVTTFNFHPHLPHYALTTDDTKLVRVLARQPVDMTHPHPFTEAGNREFNTFLWMPPNGTRAGDILLADLTIFTTLFGGTDSLDRFWNNLATRA